jgi:hypothetical protein
VSERRGCSALGVERPSVRYISHRPDQTPQVMRMCRVLTQMTGGAASVSPFTSHCDNGAASMLTRT